MSETSKNPKQENKTEANSGGIESKLNHFFSKFGLEGIQWKKCIPLAIVLVFGIALMSLSSFGGKQAGQPKQTEVLGETEAITATAEPVTAKQQSEEELLEAKLTKVLSRIAGVGEVTVSLTFAQGSKTEYAVNASTTVRSTEETDAGGGSKTVTEKTEDGQLVMGNNSSSPVAIQQTSPQVQGVLIVAEGADDPVVCTQISRAVESLLAVPLHKIVICPAGKE